MVQVSRNRCVRVLGRCSPERWCASLAVWASVLPGTSGSGVVLALGLQGLPSGPGGLVRMQVLGAPGPLLFEGGPGGVWTQGPGLLGNRPRFPEKGLIRLSGCWGAGPGFRAGFAPVPGRDAGPRARPGPSFGGLSSNPAVSTATRRGQHGWRCWAGGGGVVLRA